MALIHQTRQCIFQSTLPMRGATDMGLPSNQYLQISIHAPHAGSDRRQNSTSRIYKNFNPRSPCGERLGVVGVFSSLSIFQSTLPMRGATGRRQPCLRISGNFNPRSPCGERLKAMSSGLLLSISIHAPHAGSDSCTRRTSQSNPAFQSTLPMRGATAFHFFCSPFSMISIHAPHAGSDVYAPNESRICCHFNPRSPCGERRSATYLNNGETVFQSTLPMRGATEC